jgi:hypothetical protein
LLLSLKETISDKPVVETGNPSNPIEPPAAPGKTGKSFGDKLIENKFKVVGGILFVLIAVIGGWIGFIRYKQSAFDPENVRIEFKGNSNVRSGGELDYKISISNRNRTKLKGSVLKINHPEELIPVQTSFMEGMSKGAFYVKVGDLQPNEVRDYEVEFDSS